MNRIEQSDKAFSLMDRNRDNSISVDEFIKVTKNFGDRNVVSEILAPRSTGTVTVSLSLLASLYQGDLKFASTYLR